MVILKIKYSPGLFSTDKDRRTQAIVTKSLTAILIKVFVSKFLNDDSPQNSFQNNQKRSYRSTATTVIAIENVTRTGERPPLACRQGGVLARIEARRPVSSIYEGTSEDYTPYFGARTGIVPLPCGMASSCLRAERTLLI